ncbi:MAG TPA: FAD:protein FMN transferase [Methylobacter sp.]|jgi:thiamine biosynthesis lipoprotein
MLKLSSISFTAMGTECYLHLYTSSLSDAEAIAYSAIQEVLRIEAYYSRYHTDSFLSQINNTAQRGDVIEVDEETAGLLDYAHACYKKSDGLFDITAGILRKAWDFSVVHLPEQAVIDQLLPYIGLDKVQWQSPYLCFPVSGMELDFGGIGKEYAADRAAAVCVSLGVEHGLVDLGGDIFVIGPHPNQEPWQIGICHPRNPDIPIATVEINRGALATSGDYERFIEIAGRRYCHLLDPKSGWPVHGLSSVSVLADQCLVAGSIASIAILKGLAGIGWLNELGVRHIWVDNEGRQGNCLAAPLPS